MSDYLSRLHEKNVNEEEDEEEYTYINFVRENIGVCSIDTVREETKRNRTLNQLYRYIFQGWPRNVDPEYQVYKQKQLELTVEDGCIMWGHRLIIPPTLREAMISDVHVAHMGIVKIKSTARSYIWWPNIDKDIEDITKTWKECLENAINPPGANLHVWDWPEAPNERLHIDFLGTINNKMFTVVTDAYSKWIDIKEMKHIDAESTIKPLKEYFSTWGLPAKIVSDNGPAFRAELFKEFLRKNGIYHVLIVPYHPSSNGAAENSVKTFKNKYTLLIREGMSSHEAVARYLFNYRSTPHCTTGVSPAELQINKKFRSRWDLLQIRVGEREAR